LIANTPIEPTSRLCAQRAVGARAIVDDHRLLEAFGQFRGDQPRRDVGGAAGRERHDHADVAFGIRGALRDRRGGGHERGNGKQPAGD
jgi:hypothetical protein